MKCGLSEYYMVAQKYSGPERSHKQIKIISEN